MHWQLLTPQASVLSKKKIYGCFRSTLFHNFLPFFKRSPKKTNKQKKGHRVGVRNFFPLVRLSPMEKGHRIGMREFLRK